MNYVLRDLIFVIVVTGVIDKSHIEIPVGKQLYCFALRVT